MKITKPKISIIIPTWNTASVTYRCVLSIIKHLPKNFTEIIIVDNASTDKTHDIFSKLRSVKYVLNSSNLGYSKGCNIGALHATANYLFFLNSDIEFIDSKLADMYQFLKANSQCGIVGPQFLNPDLSVQGSVFPNQSVINAIKEFWFGYKSFSKYYPTSNQPVNVWAISGGAMLINKILFNQIGKWNENYIFYYEDLDLCRKIRNSGYKIMYFPKFKIIHHHGLSGKNLSDSPNQWRRLIPSSKIYHGRLKHYILFLIAWIGQKYHKLLDLFNNVKNK